jgi:glycosyltransferase involved in cell wall biosynthesis
MRSLISIVVCTYNRSTCLKNAVESIIAQLDDAPGTELIVIDDGSTDDTQAWMTNLSASAKSKLRYQRQPNSGLSAARNIGWQLAHGTWVAYLDDDAIAPPGWLSALVSACERAPANVGVIGGPIRLKWSTPKPLWLTPSLEEWLTSFEPEVTAASPIDAPHFRGANMICRRSALVEHGGFSTKLGRKGTSLLSREECDLDSRFRAAGLVSHFEPAPWVWHVAHQERLNRRWFWRRLFWEGISLQATASSTCRLSPMRRKARALLYAFKTFIKVQSIFNLVRFDRQALQMEACNHFCFHAGSAWGIWRAVPATR